MEGTIMGRLGEGAQPWAVLLPEWSRRAMDWELPKIFKRRKRDAHVTDIQVKYILMKDVKKVGNQKLSSFCVARKIKQS